MQTIIVSDRFDQKKLDRFLLEQFPTLSFNAIQKALRKKDIRINGAKINQNVTLSEGDEIALYITDDILYGLEIVYEDENIFVVNKKPGISVHADKHDGKMTLVELVERHFMAQPDITPQLCHRLDHYTGGLVVFAKNSEAHDIIVDKMTKHEVVKTYMTVVKGCPEPPEAMLTHYLLKDSDLSTVKVFNNPQNGALTAKTYYRVVSTDGTISRVEVTLITGRTHQIRAVLAHVGHPIIGDDKYGDRMLNKDYGHRYQTLWATKMKFNFTGNSILDNLNGMTIEVKSGF
ncbi:MAG: RluA family pseudouridine synthase [Hyphomonadaceae bacterium]|nr:RluA family pseudouridine synthase [Clostridia bacterium]